MKNDITKQVEEELQAILFPLTLLKKFQEPVADLIHDFQTICKFTKQKRTNNTRHAKND